jgi:hypothetical protein
MFDAEDLLLFAVKEAVDPVFERLDPPRRAAVIMALLGLTLIGLFLITFIMVGGHWVRRLARHRPRSGGTTVNAGDNSVSADAPPIILPDENSGDTMLLDRASRETKIE